MGRSSPSSSERATCFADARRMRPPSSAAVAACRRPCLRPRSAQPAASPSASLTCRRRRRSAGLAVYLGQAAPLCGTEQWLPLGELSQSPLPPTRRDQPRPSQARPHRQHADRSGREAVHPRGHLRGADGRLRAHALRACRRRAGRAGQVNFQLRPRRGTEPTMKLPIVDEERIEVAPARSEPALDCDRREHKCEALQHVCDRDRSW